MLAILNRMFPIPESRWHGWMPAAVLLLLLAASCFGQSSRQGMGSIPYADTNGTGVTFRVWAPNASSVTVRGEFNGWGQTTMVNEGGGSGLWSVDVPNAQAGQQYKYFLNNNAYKRDPRARRVVSSAGNSIIYKTDAFDWGDHFFNTPALKDTVIYQMHVGTFEGGNPPRTFDQAITRLDHLQNLGVNAVKVMPINEFAGGRSWGYNPADLFAIENEYGGADAFKRFVKAAHERGIAVLVDIVHNHYGPTDLDMWRFDGWSQNNLGGIYFYNDNRAHTWWGSTRPDFGRPQVRQFIRDQVFHFLEEFRVDGFRWDSVWNMITTDLGHNPDGESLLREINQEMAQTHPTKLRIAEDSAFNYSMNFQSQWDVDYRWALHGQVTQGSDSNRNMNTVANMLNGWPGMHRVVFSEAHDYVGTLNGRTRLPTEIDGGNPESIWARKRALLAAGIVMTTPGVPMLFQGQEMHETQAFADSTPLRWSRLTSHAGIVQAYTDLVHSRRNLRDGMQGLKGSGINVHHIDNANKIISYIRWDQGGQADDVVVVVNFSANMWTGNNYQIPFPSAGTWYSHFNSDSQAYQADFGGIGPSQVQASGSPAVAPVNMGMYSIQIFSKTPPSNFEPRTPSVTTSSVTDITSSGAMSGGEVSDEADSAVTERGIVWSTHPSPTIDDNKVVSGSGIGSYSSALGGLTPGQTYYVRAYATNSEGTGYGEPLVFTTPCFDGPPVALEPSNIGGTSFIANWAPLDGATSYRLDVSTSETFLAGGGAGSTYAVNFEGAGETKTDYPSGTVTLNGRNWNMTEALIGTGAGDWKNGVRSAHLRGRNGSNMTMLQDVPDGLGVISFQYRRYGVDTSQRPWAVQYSTNGGSSWTQAGSTFTATDAVQTFSATVNAVGNVRIRIILTTNPGTTGNRRINVDDISMTPYDPPQPSFIPGYENRTVFGTSDLVSGLADDGTYYYRVRGVREGGCTSDDSNTLSATTLADPWQRDSNSDGIPDGWYLQYGLDPHAADIAAEDANGNGYSNRQEYLLGTNPTDPSTTFCIINIEKIDGFPRITWRSVGGRTYSIQYANNIVLGFHEAAVVTESAVEDGVETTRSWIDDHTSTGGAPAGARYYRIQLVTD